MAFCCGASLILFAVASAGATVNSNNQSQVGDGGECGGITKLTCATPGFTCLDTATKPVACTSDTLSECTCSLQTDWKQYDGAFGTNNCTNIGSSEAGLEVCKNECRAMAGCNGFNININISQCVFRNCSDPYPKPYEGGPWKGYISYGLAPVNCSWNKWNTWSKCICTNTTSGPTCSKSRNRTKEYDGINCAGDATEEVQCTAPTENITVVAREHPNITVRDREHPTACTWNDWSDCNCTDTADGRSCIKQRSRKDGQCEESEETEACEGPKSTSGNIGIIIAVSCAGFLAICALVYAIITCISQRAYVAQASKTLPPALGFNTDRKHATKRREAYDSYENHAPRNTHTNTQARKRRSDHRGYRTRQHPGMRSASAKQNW